jgi:hypothetical protein
LIEIKIGLTQVPRELDIELSKDTSRDELVSEIEKMMTSGEGILWLTNRKNSKIAVPVSKISFIEISDELEERRVGFGA